MKNGEVPLKRIYESFSPSVLAELYRKSPDLTHAGLEELLRNYPADYLKIVPQSAIDPLTELYSKVYFENVEFPKTIAEAASNNVPVSYVHVDIDKFKGINDNYGHQVGDELLKHFSKLLKSSFRLSERRSAQTVPTTEHRKIIDRRQSLPRKDLIARLDKYEASLGRVGGDEFAIVLYGCNAEQSKEIMHCFLEKLQKAKLRHEQYGNIGISISAGISEYSSGLRPKDLIKMADDAAYYVKNLGRGRVEIYNPLMKK